MTNNEDQFQKELDQMIKRINAIREIKWISDDDNNSVLKDKETSDLAEQIKGLSQKVSAIDESTKKIDETIKPQKVYISPNVWKIIWVIIASFVLCGFMLFIMAIFIHNYHIKISLIIGGLFVLTILAITIMIIVHQVLSFLHNHKNS